MFQDNNHRFPTTSKGLVIDPYLTDNESWWLPINVKPQPIIVPPALEDTAREIIFSDTRSFYASHVPDKPKLSVKLLAYLSPLLPILGILKNNGMSKREFFNPWNWVK